MKIENQGFKITEIGSFDGPIRNIIGMGGTVRIGFVGEPGAINASPPLNVDDVTALIEALEQTMEILVASRSDNFPKQIVDKDGDVWELAPGPTYRGTRGSILGATITHAELKERYSPFRDEV